MSRHFARNFNNLRFAQIMPFFPVQFSDNSNRRANGAIGPPAAYSHLIRCQRFWPPTTSLPSDQTETMLWRWVM